MGVIAVSSRRSRIAGGAARVAGLRCAVRLLPFLALTVPSLPVIAQATSLEWAVKAAYLVKLPPFIEWPGNAYGSASSPFNLCVAGEDPFDGTLDHDAAGQQIDGHPMAIVRLATASPATHCQMIYASGDAQFIAAVLQSVRGLPILTVTGIESDGPPGSIVNFVIKDNHVRFEIDRAAASQNHLAISSKLLSIAVPPGSDRGTP
jgi:hypothetical protein